MRLIERWVEESAARQWSTMDMWQGYIGSVQPHARLDEIMLLEMAR